MAEFLMPKLGADMTAGTLLAWLKRPGDAVRRGDLLAEVDTDKGVIEFEVFTDGVVEKFLINPGDEVPVGTPLAIIREEGVPAAETPPVTAPAPPPPQAETRPTAPGTPPPAAPPGPPRLRISPAAKKLAAELGVDPATLQGTGPGGRIQREDVERAAAARKAAAGPGSEEERRARMRRTIAAAMTRSKREIPHYYLSTTIDMHRATSWLAEENARRAVADRLLYGVLLIKAVALALREVPELNAYWVDGAEERREAVHVGVAISLRGGGLVAPALHDTDRQSLGELMKSFRDLVRRARAGELRSSELSDPTITVTSLGEQGVESAYGIIYPPQVAIVGFGKLVERPWSVAGEVVSRPVLTATLSADHRVTDGHRGGLFLSAVERLLQEPEKL